MPNAYGNIVSCFQTEKELFDDYYRDTCLISKKDMIAFLQASASYQLKDAVKNCCADVHIFYGEKENRGIKKSAKIISNSFSMSALTELPEMYHGEFSINNPKEYAETVKSIACSTKY